MSYVGSISYPTLKTATVTVLENHRKDVYIVNMVKMTTSITHRTPDCVTEVCMGNTTLTVPGYYKQNATETAADKMAKVITAEKITGTLYMNDAG